MEEIKQCKPKRSGRSIAWLMEELNMAIEDEINGFIDRYMIIKMRKGDYTILYKNAQRLYPAYELIKVRNPELALALETIFNNSTEK